MQGALDTLHMVTNPTVPPWDLGYTVLLMPVTSPERCTLTQIRSVRW
jgi:hypothetical protein